VAEQTEQKPIPFPVLGEPLGHLLTALGHKLSREWPAKYKQVTGGRQIFVVHTRVALHTFNSALYLCGDVPPDPRRRREFAVSLPPLNRALLDSLFTIMFIIEDIPGRCEWFWEADWREARLDLERYTNEYGKDVAWQPYLANLSALSDLGQELARLTPEQVAKPRGLRSWLNPGAMWRHGVALDNLPPDRAFMKFLDDFLYIDLSQQTHLGGYGILKRCGILVDEAEALTDTETQFDKYRRQQLGIMTVLVLALATEIQNHFQFELHENLDLLYIWNIAKSCLGIAAEFYDRRYRNLLGG
jgi:hypothetical protein